MGKRKRNKGPRRAYLKRFSAAMVKVGGGMDRGEHGRMYTQHIKSLARGEPLLSDYHPIISASVGHDKWHEIKLTEDTNYKLSLCWYGGKAVFVEVYKAVKTLATTPAYPSTSKALEVYKMVGARRLPFGLHRPYSAQDSPPT